MNSNLVTPMFTSMRARMCLTFTSLRTRQAWAQRPLRRLCHSSSSIEVTGVGSGSKGCAEDFDACTPAPEVAAERSGVRAKEPRNAGDFEKEFLEAESNFSKAATLPGEALPTEMCRPSSPRIRGLMRKARWHHACRRRRPRAPQLRARSSMAV